MDEKDSIINKSESTLIKEYSPLVYSIAKKYSKMGLPTEDLVQEGMIGLLQAKTHYKDDKGTKFSTYAVFWIKKYILQALDKNTLHSLDAGEYKDEIGDKNSITSASEDVEPTKIIFPKELKQKEALVANLLYNEQLTLNEIADKMGISRERVRQIKQKAIRRMRALNFNVNQPFQVDKDK